MTDDRLAQIEARVSAPPYDLIGSEYHEDVPYLIARVREAEAERDAALATLREVEDIVFALFAAWTEAGDDFPPVARQAASDLQTILARRSDGRAE